jgi:hypothetical protein
MSILQIKGGNKSRIMITFNSFYLERNKERVKVYEIKSYRMRVSKKGKK